MGVNEKKNKKKKEERKNHNKKKKTIGICLKEILTVEKKEKYI